MKRVVIVLASLIMTFRSCCLGKNMIIDNDQKVANEKFEELLDALQTDDVDRLNELFSESGIQSAENFNESIIELFEYFNGTVESYNDDGGALYVETTKENDQIIQIMESSYDVVTSECEYRIAIRYVVKDITPYNVGIQSVYIIKLKDDLYPQYAYWGDAKFTPGIHVGVPNAE